MKILLVTNEYPFGQPPRIGGGGSHVFYLALGLVRAGVEVSVLTYAGGSKDGSPLEEYPNFRLFALIGRGDVMHRSVVDKALGCCRELMPDVIHGHHFDGGMLALTLAAAFDRPMVLTMHKPPKPSADKHSASDPQFMRRRDYAIWHQLATDSRIRAHIAYSKVYRDENIEVGVPRARIRPILHGVPISFLRDRANSIPRTKRLKLPTDTAIILCPLRPEKSGVRTFIEAAALLRDRYPDRPFLFIVTGDPKRGSVESRAAATRHVREARNLGLDDSVIWFQTYTLRQMWHIILRSAACVIPSEREGLPISALEAMALGTPLVASEVVGLNEVIVVGVTGLLATHGRPEEFANQIARALSDMNLRRILVDKASARVEEHFSSERMVEEHMAVYRELLVV